MPSLLDWWTCGVRCAVCGSEVSEWAGWCPDCGATLEHAGLIEDANPSGEDREEIQGLLEPPMPDSGQGQVRGTTLGGGPVPKTRGRVGRIGLVVVVAASAVAVTAGLLIASSSGNKAKLPAALAEEKLFIADPSRTGIFRADGQVVEAIQNPTADGYPSRAVRSGSGLVVYVHRGEAYMVPSAGGKPPVEVGAADSVFPASGGVVGLFVGAPAGPGSVEFISADGQLPEPGAGSTELAIGVTPVARLPTGLLLESTPRSPLGTFQLEVKSPPNTAILGAVTQVIDTDGANVAWLSCASIPPTCSLVVDDTSSDTRRVVPPVPGYAGYAPGGAYSPDGSVLAAFVVNGPSALGLEVINAATGDATVIGQVQGATGAAAWSVDGQWLYYGGGTGNLYAQRIQDGEPIGSRWKLPIQTSRTLTGL